MSLPPAAVSEYTVKVRGRQDSCVATLVQDRIATRAHFGTPWPIICFLIKEKDFQADPPRVLSQVVHSPHRHSSAMEMHELHERLRDGTGHQAHTHTHPGLKQ